MNKGYTKKLISLIISTILIMNCFSSVNLTAETVNKTAEAINIAKAINTAETIITAETVNKTAEAINIAKAINTAETTITAETVNKTAEAIKISVSGKVALFDGQKPYSDKAGIVFVPVQSFAKAIGGNVKSNKASQTDTVTKGSTVVAVTAGKSYLYINKKKTDMEAAAALKSGYVFVPLKSIVKAFGGIVIYSKYLGIYEVEFLPSAKVIADGIYKTNLEKLNPDRRNIIQRAINNIKSGSNFKNDPEGYISIPYMAMVTGKTDPKEQAVIAAWGVQNYPESVCLLNNLGYALYILKNNTSSVYIYKHALAIANDSLETIVNLGNLYLDSNNDALAKSQFENAVAIDKNYEKGWEGLYGYYMKKKDYKKAMEILTKIKPPGIIQRTRDVVQKELDKQPDTKKLDNVKDTDSLDVSEKKLDRISKAEPLSIAPIIEELDPEMAKEIKNKLGKINKKITAPKAFWLYDYNSSKDYFISSQAYSQTDIFTEEDNQINADNPIEGLSEKDIENMVQDLLKDAKDTVDKMKDIDLNDLESMADLAEDSRKLADNPFTQIAKGAGILEKDGIVSSSNFNNYNIHKQNFNKHMIIIGKEFDKGKDDIKKRYDSEMQQLLEEQSKQEDKEGLSLKFIKQRNSLKDKYVTEFGAFLENFYNRRVRPAIEKIENTQALYIKNMANDKLKKQETQIMRAQINAFLEIFSKAEAPIGSYEPESDAASQAIQKKIDQMKSNAPKSREQIPELKQFDSQQKSLFEEITEDISFEGSAGLCKLSYKKGEITLGINDPIHDEYMDLGVNLIDQSVSLTQGKGYEVGFKVAKGAKGTKTDGLGASVGYSNRMPGQKTTIYFDDSFNAVDAKITETPGSEGFSAGVSAGKADIKGSLKVETTAEGTSKLVSSLKANLYKWKLVEMQYKED